MCIGVHAYRRNDNDCCGTKLRVVNGSSMPFVAWEPWSCRRPNTTIVILPPMIGIRPPWQPCATMSNTMACRTSFSTFGVEMPMNFSWIWEMVVRVPMDKYGPITFT
eukprot:scaffold12186_cov143-Amphora_coffeaeformis.AAC.1